ncbi:hypothetical protein PPYR_11965 [Photinus pyralis]|uniref:LRRCT domain-containing protein n=2 Tax=Photinus pyralis TaxID=7054 RepID=A0A5N4ACT0_PHOPY|nr:insulin-like growth factor-binding protein complex acid labile subunit [Photinus pyralis]KAB0795126.1 hypothetical protein PPYR_11965 [Photinus pyralis]
MKSITFTLCLIVTKIQCACVPSLYELACENLSDLKNGKNEDQVTLTIGNARKTPTETLSPGTFKEYPNLEELVIVSAVNKLEVDAFRELSKLLVLKMYKNSISVLPDFAFIVLPHLVKLDLRDNNIQQIATYGPFLFQNLKTVNLSFNKLRDLNWQCFAAPGLERLIVTNNRIQEIGARGVLSPDLITLNLASNEIYHLEDDVFQDLKQLEELVLSHNRFTTLWTKFKVKSLKKLDLSHNRITAIQDSVFDGIPQVERIYLNDNLLKKLPPQFATLNLTVVHLHNNRLQNLEMITLNPFSFELTFSKNPLSCLCLDNLILLMELKGITTTDCQREYYKNGMNPTCIALELDEWKWDNGKCSHNVVMEDYLYQFLDMNENITDCQ